MKKLEDLVDSISSEIGLDLGDIARRKDALEITDEDAARLRKVHILLEPFQQQLIGSF